METSGEGRRPARARRLWGVVDPVRVVDFVQIGKTALAGGLAWWIASELVHLKQPFLAPWAAVLVVHSTVYRTVWRGGQQVAATFFAVFLAFGLGTLLGAGPLSVGLVILVGFLLGEVRWIKDEAATIATTGLVTIATGSVGQDGMLTSRLVDTSVGVVVGLAVNLLVWPPLRDRAAWSKADEIPRSIAVVLRQMADGLGEDLDSSVTEEWMTRLRRIDLQVDEAWELLWQAQESGRFNPRRSQPAGVADLKQVLHELEQAVADSLSISRTVEGSVEVRTVWDEAFRERWRALAHATADGVEAEDPDALTSLCDELERVANDFATQSLSAEAWREYGGLVMSLRNVHDSLTHVVQWNTGTDMRQRHQRHLERPRELLNRERVGHVRSRLAARRDGHEHNDDHAEP